MTEPAAGECLDGVSVVARDGHCVAEPVGEAASCRRCRGRLGDLRRDDDGYDVFVACARARQQRRIELFNAARIGGRFERASFDSFVPQNAAQHQAHEFVRMWAASYPVVTRGLLLWGPVGTGKTHLMVALFRELTLRKGVRCRFVDFGHLLADLRRAFGAEKGEPVAFAELVDAEVLLIDELGKGQLTAWELGVLDDLVTRRYNANRLTLCTTNFEPRDPAPPSANPAYGARQAAGFAAQGESLQDRMDARIYSRLHEMCQFVHLPGGDYRRRPRHPDPKVS